MMRHDKRGGYTVVLLFSYPCLLPNFREERTSYYGGSEQMLHLAGSAILPAQALECVKT